MLDGAPREAPPEAAPAARRAPTLADVREERMRRSVGQAREAVAAAGRIGLSKFIRLGWNQVEPSRPYVHGWHIDAIAEHLEAIVAGQLTRLAIAEPPGTMKSLETCVFFPAWLWGPAGLASHRILGFSYDTALSTRDALRCRRLITSPWYQLIWGDQFYLLEDENQKTRYSNNRTGFRISDYVGGGTGERGDVLLVDDPHNIQDPESEVKRQRSLLWLHETMPTRLNDPEKSGIVVIHHRLHERDVIGEILSSDMGFEYLMLPMEFEPARRCTTSIGFSDPRTEEGELLFPERFPRDVVERDKKAMGAYAVAGQFQQRPAPRGGGLIKRHWFEVVGAAPADCQWVRHWDLAATEGGGAYTAGLMMGWSRSTEMFYIRDVKRDQLSPDGVKKLISQTAAVDFMMVGRQRYAVSLPQDPGQAGKVQAVDFTRLLQGYVVYVERETGDKEDRARPFAAQAEAGNVKLVEGPYIEALLDEYESFPTGRYRDQVDASSGAFGALITHRRRGVLTGTFKGAY